MEPYETTDLGNIVGILGIILSCFGILGAGNDIMMPKMIEFPKEMFSQIEEMQQKAIQNEGSQNVPDEEFFDFYKSMEHMWDMPGWFGAWSITTGLLKLIFSGFALFVYISMLQIKPYSIKLFYWAAGLNIGLVVLKGAAMLGSMSFMALAMMFGGFFGLVVNAVFIIVVALGNKEAFNQKQPSVDSKVVAPS